MPPRGISVNIGLNHVDQEHYGALKVLRGCVNDATDMAAIAAAEGFGGLAGAGEGPLLLVEDQATTKAVGDAMRCAAKELRAGDALLLTFAGHGSRVPDCNDDEPERDQTWCLFDRQLIDDELFDLLSQFATGVRVLVLSDSCYSGSVISLPEVRRRRAAEGAGGERLVRGLTNDEARAVYERNDNAALYRSVQARFRTGRCAQVAASVILLSACQDCEVADDGFPNGRFTGALCGVWKGGAFPGNHLELHEAIYGRIGSIQRPNYLKLGAPSAAFDLQRPFTP